jgi:uncharacterized membrane protein HdeD (DUF308 family)
MMVMINIEKMVWKDKWWLVILRGIVAILFGLALIIMPVRALQIFLVLFGVFLLADGFLLALQSITVHTMDSRWLAKLIQGIFSIIIGVVALSFPGLTLLSLIYLIAFYAMVSGILQMISAWEFRKVVKGELLLLLSGILSLLFGIALILFPIVGAISLIQVVGAFEILFGIVLLALGINLLFTREPAAETVTTT